MSETVSVERSLLMAKIGSKNSQPEMAVRRAAHSLGYRFRLHRRDLPGTPDLVFPRLRKVIFVHGCFWHRHPGCPRTTTPKTRTAFWLEKFKANEARDRHVEAELRKLGWEIIVIWGCETKPQVKLSEMLINFLGRQSQSTDSVSESN